MIVTEETEEINKYLLSKDVINKYEMILTKKKVFILLGEYIRLQYKYLEIIPPRITYNYEVKYDFKSHDREDNLSYYLDKKLQTENEIRVFYFEIQKVLKNMTREEILIFNDLLLKKKSEDSICEKLSLSRTGLRPIKNSCILKLAMAFNLEILKKWTKVLFFMEGGFIICLRILIVYFGL